MSAAAFERQGGLQGLPERGQLKWLRPWLARVLGRSADRSERRVEPWRVAVEASHSERHAAYVEARVGLTTHVRTAGAFTPAQLRALAERARAAVH